ncbi:MAG: hypothetical protein C5B52_05620 [Bacteroidetes bacterium]|nr:MAG: hypothetical protein C5B52_05620 [Bacteroidota bacterium]
MKKIFALTLLMYSLTAASQQKIVTSAIVKTRTEVNFPENPAGPGGPGDAGGGDRVVIIGGPGGGGMESNNTTYFKPGWAKISSESDFGNNTVIIDEKNKKTTTLIEAMGRKQGFYSTEADEEEIRKQMQTRMDSMRKANGQPPMVMNNSEMPEPEIVYLDETKKIAGYNCKKAVLKIKGRNGEVNETIVWYCPDFKMADGYPLGGGKRGRVMGGGPYGGDLVGLEKINGFPMAYEFSRSNGFKLKSEVTKLELDATIDDKVFEIPKGFEVKALKDMRGPGGSGTFDIRITAPDGN